MQIPLSDDHIGCSINNSFPSEKKNNWSSIKSEHIANIKAFFKRIVPPAYHFDILIINGTPNLTCLTHRTKSEQFFESFKFLNRIEPPNLDFFDNKNRNPNSSRVFKGSNHWLSVTSSCRFNFNSLSGGQDGLWLPYDLCNYVFYVFVWEIKENFLFKCDKIIIPKHLFLLLSFEKHHSHLSFKCEKKVNNTTVKFYWDKFNTTLSISDFVHKFN